MPRGTVDVGDELSDLPALFEQIYEATGLPMLMLGPDFSVLGASDERRLAEVPASGVVDRPLRERLPQYLAALQGGVPGSVVQQAGFSRALPNGNAVHERLQLRRTAWGACLSVIDQTDLRQSETTDLQTTRLAALGFMVAGVCHEVTNPLTSLHSIVQILRAEQPPSPELLAKGLDNIAINVKRILEISRRLVKFSRVGDEPRRHFAVDEAVGDALDEWRQQGRWQDIVVVHRPDPMARAYGNPGQVRQILLNLFMNAAQAMAGHGRLTIDVRLAGRMAEVLVTDTGPGVPEAIAGRIFEPFFTTRSETHGTGLGLSVSTEIAHEHRGAIALRHNAATGAGFCVSLPMDAS